MTRTTPAHRLAPAYQYFNNINRYAGRYPIAHTANKGEEVTVWCSNDVRRARPRPAPARRSLTRLFSCSTSEWAATRPSSMSCSKSRASISLKRVTNFRARPSQQHSRHVRRRRRRHAQHCRQRSDPPRPRGRARRAAPEARGARLQQLLRRERRDACVAPFPRLPGLAAHSPGFVFCSGHAREQAPRLRHLLRRA